MKALGTALLVMAAAFAIACLDQNRGVLAYKDTVAPSVQSVCAVRPSAVADGGSADGGTDAGSLNCAPFMMMSIQSTDSLQITFSEAMEIRTLTPGIELLKGTADVPILLTVPDVPSTVQNSDAPYTVTVRPAAGTFEVSQGPTLDYTLILRKLLTDEAGNPLADELRFRFLVR